MSKTHDRAFMTYLLYLNLWGTTAKILEDKELAPASQLSVCQARFQQLLIHAAAADPEVQVAHLGDVAFVTHPRLESLVMLAAYFFAEMFAGAEGEFRFWPLRGAIGASEKLIATSKSNFHSASGGGPSAVEIGRLEKSAQKGARLFLSQQLESEFEIGRATRLRETRGLAHQEINWLALTPRRLELIEPLRLEATRLIAFETNYSQQMAGSLLELIRWSGELQRSAPLLKT